MMHERMVNALELADKCWGKAYHTSPEFVKRYIELAEALLTERLVVTGDEFRAYCSQHGLYRHPYLHPNVWVSGVRFLHKGLGWITPIRKVEPVKMHNHMPSVTEWRSNLI